MTLKQEPAKVRGAETDSSILGAPQDTIEGGSGLSKAAKQRGTEAPAKRDPSDRTQLPTLSDSALSRIMMGKRAVHEFDFPGSDVRCGVVVLTEAEIEEAGIAACDRLADARKRMDDISYQTRLEIECDIQFLARCLVNPDTGHPFALNADEIRDLVDQDTCRVLVSEYVDHQERMSPLTNPMLTEPQMKMIVEALKKNPSPDIEALSGISAVQLRHLLTYMVLPHIDSPQSNGSATDTAESTS